MIRGLLIAFMLRLPVAQATEGFSSDPKAGPPAVQKAWNSVFSLVTTSPKFHGGTAFLILKIIEGDRLSLYFFTAAHNLAMCTVHQVCPSTSLIQDVEFWDSASAVEMAQQSDLRFDRVVWEADVPEAKLGLLKVTLPLDTKDLPEAIPLANDCAIPEGEKLYGIGWSWTALRPGLSPTVVKRWSEGRYLGRYKFTDEKYPLAATSVDAIEGASGGPILTEAGLAISFMDKSAKGFRYKGNDNPAKSAYQVLGPTCEFFKSIRASLKL